MLRQNGHTVGRQRLRPCAAGAYVRCNPRPIPHVQPTPRTGCAPNRLLDQPKPIQANQVWGSDSTYLPLANDD